MEPLMSKKSVGVTFILPTTFPLMARKAFLEHTIMAYMLKWFWCWGFVPARVSVQGVKSLGGHFACLCQGVWILWSKKKLALFFKKKMEILLHF